LTVAVQASTTDAATSHVIRTLWKDLGFHGTGYTFQEKDPTKHKDAHYLRFNRIGEVQQLIPLVLPYAVTKQEQWQLLLEFINSRLLDRPMEKDGRVKRGGNTYRIYTPREIELAIRLRELNARGPKAARAKKDALWIQRVQSLLERSYDRKD